MLTIRLNRTGKRNRVSYRLVVQEKTQAPGKRHIEVVGSRDPHQKTTLLNTERILHWIGQGAQPSAAVHNLLVSEGVIQGEKIAKKMPRPEAPAAEAASEEAAETGSTPTANVADEASEAAPESATPETPQAESELENPTPEEAALEAEAIPESAAEERAEAKDEVQAEKAE